MDTTHKFMPDPHSAAAGTFLALQFMLCLAAEYEGETFPDPYRAVESRRGEMAAALTVLTGLLEVPNTKRHRQAVVRFLAALADMVEAQGSDLQSALERLRNPDQMPRGTVSAELTTGGNLRITATAELPDFEDLEPEQAADAAVQVARTVIHELVTPITDAVFSAAGFERKADDFARKEHA